MVNMVLKKELFATKYTILGKFTRYFTLAHELFLGDSLESTEKGVDNKENKEVLEFSSFVKKFIKKWNF